VSALLGIDAKDPDQRLAQLDSKIDTIQKGMPQVGTTAKALGGLANLSALVAGNAGYEALYGGGAGLAAGPEAAPLGAVVGRSLYNFHYGVGSIREALSKVTDKNGKGLDEDTMNTVSVLGGFLASGGSALAYSAALKMIPESILDKLVASGGKAVVENPATFKQAAQKYLLSSMKNIGQGSLGMTEFAAVQQLMTGLAKKSENASTNKQFETDFRAGAGEVAQTAVDSTLMFGAGHVLGAGAQGALAKLQGQPFNREFAMAARVEREQQFLKEMGEAAKDSKLRARLPEAHEQFIKELTGGTPVETAFMPAPALTKYFQQSNVEGSAEAVADHLGVGEQYRKDPNGTLAIPFSTYVSKFAGTPAYAALAGDVKFDPEGPTLNELTELKEAQKQQLKAAQESAVKNEPGKPDMSGPHAEIKEDIARQLTEAGYLGGHKYRDQIIKAEADTAAHHYVTEAQRRNVDVGQLYAAEGPRIVGQDGKVLTSGIAYPKLSQHDAASLEASDAARRSEPQPERADAGRGSDGEGAGRGALLQPASSLRPVPEARHSQPLSGPLPKDFPGPTPEIRLAAEVYAREHGLPITRAVEYVRADPARGRRIADAFAEMQHSPNDPTVRAAYDALIRETLAQYQVMKKMGLKIEAIPKDAANPYKNSAEMIADVRNGHLWFFPTDYGFGSSGQPDAFSDHPLYSMTGENLEDGTPLRANDIFRVVHDFFGHAKEGNGFGAHGEENAWQSHVRMYSPLAGLAMTTETRGQNSWVNFHPDSEANRTKPGSVYADQKAGLLPDWVMHDGIAKESGALEQAEKATAPTFYSKLQKDIEAKLPNKATVEQVEALLRDTKQDERDWSGIDSFLYPSSREDKSRKIEKEKLLDWLRVNNLKINEVEKGDDLEPSQRVTERAREILDEKFFDSYESPFYPTEQSVEDVDTGESKQVWRVGHAYDSNYARRDSDSFESEEAAQEAADKLNESDQDAAYQDYMNGLGSDDEAIRQAERELGTSTSTQYEDYTLPGGDDYRELLFTLPERLRIKGQKNENFGSSHFEEKNIFAHVRFKTRKDADGKRVLFIEEIQSDWHQRGRDKGYRTPEADAEYAAQFAEFEKKQQAWKPLYEAAVKKEDEAYEKALDLYHKGFQQISEGDKEKLAKLRSGTAEDFLAERNADYKKAQADFLAAQMELNALKDQKPPRPNDPNYDSVPNAPFKKTWHEFVLKRMLRHAAENGYDKIAWTTGEQQAERYSLNKQVDKLSYDPQEKTLEAFRYGSRVINTKVTPEGLPDIIGREATEKLLAQEPVPDTDKVYARARLTQLEKQVEDTGRDLSGAELDEANELRAKLRAGDRGYDDTGKHVLSGMDLKVGGQGMKGFYDKIVPAFLSKFTKKWGGEVGESQIGAHHFSLVEENGKFLVRRKDGTYVENRDVPERLTDDTFSNAQHQIAKFSSRDEAQKFGDDHFAGIARGFKAHSLDINDRIRSAAMNEGFPLFQKTFGEYYPDSNVIRLLKDANASTFLHESAHGWLKSMHDFVKSGQATQEYLDHWQAAKDYLKIADDQKELTTEQQEKFADAFETYMSEGKAPTKELSGLFFQFARWLSDVFKRVRRPDVEMSPEIRGFMDRMLATNDAIEQAAQEAGFQPGAAEQLSRDPAEQQRARTLEERAYQKAFETLLSEQMREFSQENKDVLGREREKLRAKAEPEVAELPLYKAMEDVEENRPGARRTAFSLAQDFLGSKLSAQEMSAFEAAAEVHGFSDGRDLAESIVADQEAGGREASIKGRVDKGMEAFADLRNTDKLRERAAEAILNDKGLELMALETKLYDEMKAAKDQNAEVARRKRIDAAAEARAAREQARAILADKPVSEAGNFRAYFTAMKNAAVKAAKSEDPAEAAQFKREQMLNAALASEALKNKREIEKTLAYVKKFSKRGSDLLNMPYSFNFQIDGILEQRGLSEPRDKDDATMQKIAADMAQKNAAPNEIANATGFVRDEKGQWQRETLPQFVQRVNDNYYALELPDSVSGSNGKPLSQAKPDMTMGELRDLKAALRSISSIGKTFERFLSDFIKGDLKTNAAEFKKYVEENIGKPYGDQPALGELDLSKLQQAVEKIKAIPDGMISDKVNLLTLCEYLDRMNPDGPAKNNIYRPLEHAWNDERVMREKKTKELDAIRKQFYSDKEIAGLADTFDKWEVNGKPVKITKEGALVLLLNRGTESNIDRLTRGFGVDEARIREITDKLDKRDHDFAQATWDYLDTFWPQAKALELDVKGNEAQKVAARPVESPHGTYKGGYYPLAYDFNKSNDAYVQQLDRNAEFKTHSTAAAHTSQGFLKTRVDTLARPVRLDFSGMYNHLDDVIHDLTHRKAVIDVSRFLAQPDVKDTISNAIGNEGYRKIGEDLKAVGSAQTEFLTPGEQRWRWFRFGTTFATLGYRAVILPRRLTEDVVNSFREVPFRNLIGSIGDTVMNPTDTRDFVREKSALMRERQINRERDLIDMSKEWKGEGSRFKQFAFLQDTIADQAMSYPVWNAVYKAHLAEFGDERAAMIADESIVKTFGSGRELDRIGAQRGGELSRIASMYYSWHSMMFNRAWLQGKIAGLEYHEGNLGKAMAIIASTTATTWIIPAATHLFWSELFRNSQNDDEDSRKKRDRGALHRGPVRLLPDGPQLRGGGGPVHGRRARRQLPHLAGRGRGRHDHQDRGPLGQQARQQARARRGEGLESADVRGRRAQRRAPARLPSGPQHVDVQLHRLAQQRGRGELARHAHEEDKEVGRSSIR
jgi:hypothetical protein